jgi:hypothetical protein
MRPAGLIRLTDSKPLAARDSSPPDNGHMGLTRSALALRAGLGSGMEGGGEAAVQVLGGWLVAPEHYAVEEPGPDAGFGAAGDPEVLAVDHFLADSATVPGGRGSSRRGRPVPRK